MTLTPSKVDIDADSASRRHIPGEAGLWFVILGDMAMFAAMFAFYLQGRAQQPELFAQSQDTLNRDLGAVNTVLLLTSSLLVVFATHTVGRAANPRIATRLIVGAMACGLAFVLIKVFEYYEKVAAGITPNTNEFYMYYFGLTGLHLAHLIVGLYFLGILRTLTRKPVVTTTQHAFFEGAACFWHLVDLLWIVIFPLVFLVR